jgi:hypothetical protein
LQFVGLADGKKERVENEIKKKFTAAPAAIPSHGRHSSLIFKIQQVYTVKTVKPNRILFLLSNLY